MFIFIDFYDSCSKIFLCRAYSEHPVFDCANGSVRRGEGVFVNILGYESRSGCKFDRDSDRDLPVCKSGM